MTLAPSGTLRVVQLWLVLFNSLGILLGMLLVFGSSSFVFSGYRRSLAEVFWQANAVPPAAGPFFTWSMGLIGAATVGWAVTNLFVVLYALGRAQRWSLAALGFSTLSWAALEIMVSRVAGAHVEIYFVVAAGGAVLIPVLIAWRAMSA